MIIRNTWKIQYIHGEILGSATEIHQKSKTLQKRKNEAARRFSCLMRPSGILYMQYNACNVALSMQNGKYECKYRL